MIEQFGKSGHGVTGRSEFTHFKSNSLHSVCFATMALELVFLS